MFWQNAQGRLMLSDNWAPMLTNNPSLCNKSLRASMKVEHVKLFQEGVRVVPQYAVTANNRNREPKKSFFFLEKKSKPKEKFYNNEF